MQHPMEDLALLTAYSRRGAAHTYMYMHALATDMHAMP